MRSLDRSNRTSSRSSLRGWIAVTCLLAASAAQGHVSITPRQSQVGATEKYVVRIPTEGNVATIGADLEAPEGVIIETLQIPTGWTYEVKRADDRIVSIAWNVDVKPGEFIEVAFVARNPRQGTEIVWTLRQRFADGSVTDWTNGPNGVRPTARTALTPRPQ
jgi:uncharacterized protein YcnI